MPVLCGFLGVFFRFTPFLHHLNLDGSNTMTIWGWTRDLQNTFFFWRCICEAMDDAANALPFFMNIYTVPRESCLKQVALQADEEVCTYLQLCYSWSLFLCVYSNVRVVTGNRIPNSVCLRIPRICSFLKIGCFWPALQKSDGQRKDGKVHFSRRCGIDTKSSKIERKRTKNQRFLAQCRGEGDSIPRSCERKLISSSCKAGSLCPSLSLISAKFNELVTALLPLPRKMHG